MEYVICHYHEIGLKGGNRKFFEEKLVSNIKRSLGSGRFEFVKRISGRILVKLKVEGAKERTAARRSLESVFGIAYFAFAQSCGQDIESIEEAARQILERKKFKSFRITASRSKKDFPLTSQEINEKVGACIVKKLKKKVDLGNPGATCFIEIVDRYAFLYTKKIKGLGGLPSGSSGKAAALISGGIDSPVASFYIMKRGVRVVFLHFHAYPYTNKASIEKVQRTVKALNRFQFASKLHLIPFGDIQKEILLKAPEKLRVVLYRRFMLRISQILARKEGALAVVTGESVGQVASQTLENLMAIEEVADLPMLRPLIGQDKEEIINKAKEIGTFDISILPDQDCCARFLPKHPETRADLWEVKKAEKRLSVKKLTERSVKNSKTINY